VVFVVAAAVTALAMQGASTQTKHVRPAVMGAVEERTSAPRQLADSIGAALAPVTSPTTTPAASATSASGTTLPGPEAAIAPVAATATPPAPLAAPAAATPNASVDLIARAQAMVHYDYIDALRGWSIEFVGPRDGFRGATFPASHVVQIYVRRSENASELAHTLAHELGHAIDVTYFDDQDRAQFNVARGRDAASAWWVAPSADDFASGAGDWAECFAWTVTNGAGGFFSKLGPAPDSATKALVMQLAH